MRRARSRRARGPAGFTLVELVVVVLILGLLAAIAVPATGGGYEARLDVVELQLRDAFLRASTLARTTGATHGVVFDTATDRFAVVDGSGDPAMDPLTQRDYIVDFERPGQPKSIDVFSAAFGSNGKAAIFDRQGLPLDDGTIVLRCKTASRTLLLDKATGELTLP